MIIIAKELKIKIGVELDKGKINSDVQSLITQMQNKKVKIGFDVDNKALNSLKNTLEGFKNIKIGVNADTSKATSSTKSITNSIKETNNELNQQKQIYSQLKSLQNEEYAIKKKMIGANGEYKATLQQQLSSIQQQQLATRGLLAEGNKSLVNKQKEAQLTDQQMKKERELAQVKAKANVDMERAIEKAKSNMNFKGLDTKSIEEYKKRLDDIDRTNMNHVRSEIASIGSEVDAQRNKLNDLSKTFQSISDVANGVGNALMSAFALPVAGLTAGTKVMMDFTAEMSNVQAISGVSAQEMQSLENEAKLMGRTTVKSAKESAEALKYMGMA